jgi:hypothetical protein
VLRDVPELGISKSQARSGLHREYNSRVHHYERDFQHPSRRHQLLVVGDSFARDWVNILLESRFADSLGISYMDDATLDPVTLRERSEAADIVFYSAVSRSFVQRLGVDPGKVMVVGPKNFGKNAGYFYNRSGEDYASQRTLMRDGYLERNRNLKEMWGARYVDLIAKVIDEANTVPVFTPDAIFISQDCLHLTKAGAAYFARLLDRDLETLLGARKAPL